MLSFLFDTLLRKQLDAPRLSGFVRMPPDSPGGIVDWRPARDVTGAGVCSTQEEKLDDASIVLGSRQMQGRAAIFVLRINLGAVGYERIH
jgi:hypothetical protein